MTEAPYRDPAGAPSWQPNPEVRASDAWNREWASHVEKVRKLEEMIAKVEDTWDYLRGELEKAKAEGNEFTYRTRGLKWF